MAKKSGIRSILMLAGLMGFGLAMAFPSSAPVGSLMGSKNATLDGQAVLPHTTLLSGDKVQVNDGLAMVALEQGNRMILGRETEASFLREADRVSISLTHGNLALYHPQASQPFRVKVGDVTVAPEDGIKTMGEISMLDGLLVVTAKDGTLKVEKAGTTQEVSKGKTITMPASAGSAPTPVPDGNVHLKHIWKLSPAALLYLGIGAGVGLTIWGIVEATSGGGPPASPVAP